LTRPAASPYGPSAKPTFTSLREDVGRQKKVSKEKAMTASAKSNAEEDVSRLTGRFGCSLLDVILRFAIGSNLIRG
jgi:hypothetical protein